MQIAHPVDAFEHVAEEILDVAHVELLAVLPGRDPQILGQRKLPLAEDCVGRGKQFLRTAPLGERLKARIARDGPISVEAYMQACLTDPAGGYYATRQPIGGDGDFVTAPEVSQIFGELIGLWAAAVWQSMGAPRSVVSWPPSQKSRPSKT